MVLESDFPPDIRVENELGTLTDVGYKITLLCATRSKEREGKEVFSDQLVVYRKKLSTFLYKSKVGQLKFPFYDLFWKTFLKRHLSQNGSEKYDIVHVHDLSLAKIGIWLKKQINTPVVLDLHENYPYLIKDAKHTQKGLGRLLSDYKQWLQFEKQIIPKADYVICVVEEMKQRLLQFDNRPKNYHIYQNVVNLKSINPYVEPQENDYFKLIYIGGLTPARGIQTVIDAIALLLTNQFKIVFEIYGDGSFFKELKSQTSTLNLDKAVKFKGKIPQDQVFEKIQKSDAAIIPHYKSVQNNCSSPNKLYQYLSTGRAVIASDCDSVRRVVEENGVGKTYKDKDQKDLAGVLEYLILNPKERIQLGKRGYQLVKDKFNTSNEGKKLAVFYNSITH